MDNRETVMRTMAKLAIEEATTFFAAQARDFAKNLPDDVGGRQALQAFANAIEKTNQQQYPTPKGGPDA